MQNIGQSWLVLTLTGSPLLLGILGVVQFLAITIFSLLQELLWTGSLAFTGVFNIFFSTTDNSTLQMNSTDEYRGRVMSVYSLFFSGVTPIGNLFSGYVADKSGASYGFVLSGIISLILVIILFMMFRRKNNEESVNKSMI